MKQKQSYKVENYPSDMRNALYGIGKCQFLHLLEDLPSVFDEHKLIKGDGIFGVEISKINEIKEGKFYVIKLDEKRITIGKYLFVKDNLPYFQVGESSVTPYPLEMVLNAAAVSIKTRDLSKYLPE